MVKKEAKKKEIKELGEGLGISGFTLGVLSIILAGWVGILTSVVGFVFCYSQQKNMPTKLGKTGLILNIIGFVISLIFVIIFVSQIYPLINAQIPA
ncbi:hypothetical protein K9L16_02170 [Candidatus Pacearchaeota archaeon]|nr:hypothetical protein [Candidatus Pacearchaeota archaeon]